MWLRKGGEEEVTQRRAPGKVDLVVSESSTVEDDGRCAFLPKSHRVSSDPPFKQKEIVPGNQCNDRTRWLVVLQAQHSVPKPF